MLLYVPSKPTALHYMACSEATHRPTLLSLANHIAVDVYTPLFSCSDPTWQFAGQGCADFVSSFGEEHCSDEMYSGEDTDGNSVTATEACVVSCPQPAAE